MVVTAGGILGLIAAGIVIYILYRIVKKKMKGGIKSYANLEYPKEETEAERRSRERIAGSGDGVEGIEGGGTRSSSSRRAFKFSKSTTPTSDERESDVEATSEPTKRIDVDKRDKSPKRKFRFSS